RKVRRLVDIRYRVPSRRSGWGDTFPSVGKEAGRMAAKDGRTPDYRKSHGLTAVSPAPLPASSCPPNAAPWRRRPRDERLMARWSRLLHCSGAPPAVAPDPASARRVFLRPGLPLRASPALERHGKALRLHCALPGSSVAGNLGYLCLRATGSLFRPGGALLCGRHRCSQGRLAPVLRIARAPRAPGFRFSAGLDPAGGCRHPQLFRRHVERRLAGTFPEDAVLPPAFPEECANLRRLPAPRSPSHDECAGRVLPGSNRAPV